MKAQIIDLGRDKHNATITVKDEPELHKYIKKYVLSKFWGMEKTEDPDVWDITSGWNVIGQVKILEY